MDLMDGKQKRKVDSLIFPKSKDGFFIETKDYIRIAVQGISGVGKSVFAARYCKNYLKKYKNRSAVLLSPVENDPAYKDIDGLKIIPIEVFLEAKFQEETLRDTLVIFDDCHSAPKNVQKKLLEIQEFVLQRGRHLNCSTISLFHISSYGKTRSIYNESHYIVFFPNSTPYQNRRLLTTYVGLSKKMIDSLLDLAKESRWVCIFNHHRQTAIGEKFAVPL